MLRTNIPKLKQKVLLTITVAIIFLTSTFWLMYLYFMKVPQQKVEHSIVSTRNNSFVTYLEQNKRNIELIANIINETYNDITLSQRYFVREKRAAIRDHYQYLENSILSYVANPFFVAVCQNLVEGFMQDKTKSSLWRKYNSYSNELAKFAEQHQFETFYIVSEDGQVVWSLQKEDSLFQQNLNNVKYAEHPVYQAYLQQKNTNDAVNFYHEESNPFATSTISTENKKKAILLWQLAKETNEKILWNNKLSKTSDIILLRENNIILQSLSKKNQKYTFPLNLANQNDTNSFIYENFQHQTSIASFVHVAKHSWTLMVEQNLEDVLLTKVEFFENLYNHNEGTSFSIFYSKARKLLYSTKSSYTIELGKMQNILLKELNNDSFSIFIEETNGVLGNIYLMQKIILSEDFPIFIVEEITKEELQKTWGYSKTLFLQNTKPRNIEPSNTNQFMVFEKKFVYINVASPSSNIFFIILTLAVLLLTIAVSYSFLKMEINSIYKAYNNTLQKKESKLSSFINFSDIIDKNYDKICSQRNLINDLETEISKSVILHQEIGNIIGYLDRAFIKFKQVATKNTVTVTEITNILEQVNKNSLEVADMVIKAKHFNATVNVLSLNASVEASNQKEKTSFSTLATEYQNITKEIEAFSTTIIKNVKNNTEQMAILKKLSHEEVVVAKETTTNMENKYKTLEELQGKYSKQKNTLQQLNYILNEIISTNLETREEIENISRMLRKILQNERNMIGT